MDKIQYKPDKPAKNTNTNTSNVKRNNERAMKEKQKYLSHILLAIDDAFRNQTRIKHHLLSLSSARRTKSCSERCT